jgi:hypothetical protein
MPHTRMFWQNAGAHVKVEFFSAPKATMQHARNGELVFSLREWAELKAVFAKHPDVFELLEGAR